MRTLRAFAVGAGAAYLHDPVRGKRRRRMLVDRIARAFRRLSRFVSRRLGHRSLRMRGLAADIGGAEPAVRPIDDAAVLQRIRSDALRDVGVSTSAIDVSVEDGVATIRGEVSSATLADDLVDAVRAVPGVKDVAAMIHVSEAS